VKTSESAPVKKVFSPKEYFEEKVVKAAKKRNS
jgi:hypothetical protein